MYYIIIQEIYFYELAFCDSWLEGAKIYLAGITPGVYPDRDASLTMRLPAGVQFDRAIQNEWEEIPNMWRVGYTVLAGIAAMAVTTVQPAMAGKSNDTLVWATDREIAVIDPYYNNTRELVVMGHLGWDALLFRDIDTGEFKPLLATGYKWVDNLTLEFDLRKGVKFHDGSDFDAEDVVYTINHVSKKENGVLSYKNVKWMKNAEKLGIKDNDWVEVYNDHGVYCTRAVVSARIPRGVCIVYHVPERTTGIPKSQERGNKRAGGHNSVTRIHLKPNFLSGGYGQFSYHFNYWGPIAPNRDTHVTVKKMDKVVW